MDHFPIVMVFYLTLTCTTEEPKFNFRATDWSEFHDGLKAQLVDINLRDPETVEDFELMLSKVTDAILDNMKVHIPVSQPSPYAK
jgi:hypothetical protein